MNLSRENEEMDRIRTENIIKIGLSKNIEGFRRGCQYISKEGLYINTEGLKIDEIMEKGMAEIETLAGDRKEYFLCIEGVKEKGLQGYFDYITKGKKENTRKENQRVHKEDRLRVLKEREERMAEQGNFKEEQMCKIQIMQETQPEVVLELLKNQYAQTGVKDRQELKKEIEKYTEIIKEETEYSEVLDYYKGVHYNLRELLLGYFYKDKVSENPLRYLQSNKGSIQLDFEHLRLLELQNKEKDIIGVDILKAIRVYLALESYYSEVQDLKTKSEQGVKGRIAIHFSTNPDNFNAGKVHQYKRGYMIKATKPKGTRCYEIKPSNLNRRCLNMSVGIKELEYEKLPSLYKEASKELKKKEKPLVYKGLSEIQEEEFIPRVLNEKFTHRDGLLKEEIDKEFGIRYHKYSKNTEKQGNLSNVYNRIVQPYCMDILGSVVLKLLKYLEAYKGDVWVYYISSDRLGIAIKESLEESYDKEILKEVWNISKRVGDITYQSIIDGLK